MARVYLVSFRTHDDRRRPKFIVLANDMRAAINEAWSMGGADFQSRFDKSTARAVEMKKGGLAGAVIKSVFQFNEQDLTARRNRPDLKCGRACSRDFPSTL
jgi:hypothetical protein